MSSGVGLVFCTPRRNHVGLVSLAPFMMRKRLSYEGRALWRTAIDKNLHLSDRGCTCRLVVGF